MPAPLSREEELRRLVVFTDQLQYILAVIVARPHYIVPGRHHELLAAAWAEILPAFKDLRGSLNSKAIPQLSQVGLTGYRLQFELGVFAHARDQLLDYAPELFAAPVLFPPYPPTVLTSEQVPISPSPRKKKSWWRRLGARILSCLKAGDVVLGSLAKVFPPAEIITQVKEGVEESISIAKTFAETA
jgi:hypothetical protein